MYVVGEELPAVFGNSAPKGNYADMRTDGWGGQPVVARQPQGCGQDPELQY